MSVYNTIYDFSYYICIHYKTCFSLFAKNVKTVIILPGRFLVPTIVGSIADYSRHHC